MTDLCRNCGHALPNAAGPGLYCTECGEPVKDKPSMTIPDDTPEGTVVARGHISPEARAATERLLFPPDDGLAVAGDALELLDQAILLLDEWCPVDIDDEVDVKTIDSRRDAVVRRYDQLRHQPVTAATMFSAAEVKDMLTRFYNRPDAEADQVIASWKTRQVTLQKEN